MMPFSEVVYSAGGTALRCLAMLLVLAQVYLCLMALWLRCGPGLTGLTWLHAGAGFLSLWILLDGTYYAETRQLPEIVTAVYRLPWPVILGAELFSLLLIVLTGLSCYRHYQTALSADSIKQALDMLPEGVSFSDRDGVPVMVNLRMHEFVMAFTGRRLTNDSLLWKKLLEAGENRDGKRLVTCQDGRALLFDRDYVQVGGRAYRQLTATDVTDLHRVSMELEEKNARLQDIQRRIKAVSQLSSHMFVAQEESRARVALHNHMGQVLLMGRHLLEQPENTDPAMVYMAMRQMNQFLLGEVREPYGVLNGTMEAAAAAVRSIGVAVTVSGTLPEDERILGLFAQAVEECAANAVKHARGNQLYAEARSGEGAAWITLRNNGDPPRSTITESGGLKSLRRQTEAMGGSMRVESSPAFSLTLSVPTGRSAHAPGVREPGNQTGFPGVSKQ